jgi:hypothetical protein
VLNQPRGAQSRSRFPLATVFTARGCRSVSPLTRRALRLHGLVPTSRPALGIPTRRFAPRRGERALSLAVAFSELGGREASPVAEDISDSREHGQLSLHCVARNCPTSLIKPNQSDTSPSGFARLAGAARTRRGVRTARTTKRQGRQTAGQSPLARDSAVLRPFAARLPADCRLTRQLPDRSTPRTRSQTTGCRRRRC